MYLWNSTIYKSRNPVKILKLIAPGRRHDKRFGDKEHLFIALPKEVTLFVDTGFQGVAKLHKNTYILKKRRKDKPLPKRIKR